MTPSGNTILITAGGSGIEGHFDATLTQLNEFVAEVSGHSGVTAPQGGNDDQSVSIRL